MVMGLRPMRLTMEVDGGNGLEANEINNGGQRRQWH
jgi:hypothetical protein